MDLGVMQFWEQGAREEWDDKIFKRSIPMWISWGIFVMKCNFGNELTEPEWDFIFKSILIWMRCGMFMVFWESPEWYNYMQGDFFNWASPEFAKCWPVSDWFQKNVKVPDWPPLGIKNVKVFGISPLSAAILRTFSKWGGGGTLGQYWLLKQFCLNHPVEHI